jgi:hypothetical protein
VESTGWEMQRVDYFHVWSSEGARPHLSRLRTDRLTPVSKFDYVLAHTRFMGSHKLSILDGHRDGSYPTIPPRCISG